MDVFQNHEVNLRVLDQNIGLGSASGRLMLNLLASFAEMEVDQIAERVKPAIPNSERFCAIPAIRRFLKKSQALARQRF